MKRLQSLIAVLGIVTLLTGCAGSGDTTSSGGGGNPGAPYEGKTYTEKSVPFSGGKTGDVTISVDATGKISGKLTSTTALPKMTASSRAAGNFVYDALGSFTGDSGGFRLAFLSLTNASITGTLPGPPATVGGTFTIVINGTNYGPYPFGGTISGGSGKYDISIIGLLPGASYSQPNDINDNGMVVGGSDANGGLDSFTWTKTGGLKDMNVTAQYSSALFVNNNGVVVGQFTPVSGDLYHPHVYVSQTGSGGTDIGLPSGYTSILPAGLTANGVVIAEGSVPNNTGTIPETAVSYNGSFTEIGPAPMSQVVSVCKNTGLVYGNVYNAQGIHQWWKYSGGATSVPESFFKNIKIYATVPGAYMGPNNQIIGQKNDNQHAAIFNADGTVIDLGIVGSVKGYNGTTAVVNNDTTGPVVWTQAAGAKPINSLIDPAAGITIFRVWGINAGGQIIASATSTHIHTSALGLGVVLTPHP